MEKSAFIVSLMVILCVLFMFDGKVNSAPSPDYDNQRSLRLMLKKLDNINNINGWRYHGQASCRIPPNLLDLYELFMRSDNHPGALERRGEPRLRLRFGRRSDPFWNHREIDTGNDN